MSHLYLASYVGRGTWLDCYRPRGSEQPGWSAIDLRPDASLLDGHCLVSLPVRDDTVGEYLGNDLDGKSAVVYQTIGSRLGLNLDSVTLRQIIAELLIAHSREDGTRWRSLMPSYGWFEIWLGGLLCRFPAFAGGTTLGDTFVGTNGTTMSSHTATGPNSGFSWTNVAGSWEIQTNAAQRSANNLDLSRAESDLETADHYVQGVSATNGSSSAVPTGLAFRFSPSASTCYAILYEGQTPKLSTNKIVAGTTTLLGSGTTGVDIAIGDVYRGEASGSSILRMFRGVTQETITDTSIFATRRCGLAANQIPGSSMQWWETWEAGDLTGGIRFVGAAAAATSSVTLPAHVAGDLIIIIASREDGGDPETIPTVPGGYTPISGGGQAGAFFAAAVGYKLAASSSETSGTWTNATAIAVSIYRGCKASSPVGVSSGSIATSSNLTFNALTLDGGGKSWVVGLGAHRTASSLGPPSEMIKRAEDSAIKAAINDTVGRRSSWLQQTFNTGGNNVSIAWSVELLADVGVAVNTNNILLLGVGKQ